MLSHNPCIVVNSYIVFTLHQALFYGLYKDQLI